MQEKVPRMGVLIIRMMVPRFKRSPKKNIDAAYKFCKNYSTDQTQKVISEIEDRINTITSRTANEKQVQFPSVDNVVSKVVKYGESCISKVKARSAGSPQFDSGLFESLCMAKLRLATTSISEKLILITKRQFASQK